ncbi:hypothetical protein N7539_008994 [Penicillium diatomitis]|uniref:Non-structural maintenance of chromosomes element 1 homolog n=1 Tax=Penicillium diatomitis TaxID=2819901 RepID=A0A9W9WL04_9EURO|nr:uncharacterized protein N7539_008994 [Penicillium diatomitis]KAJ5469376.1 hypothetical protein N7539_008994 [Penicillium diatomitis]
MDIYDDRHRAFLQAFMARSTMTFEESQPVLAAIISAHESRDIAPEDVTQSTLNDFVDTVNGAISTFDLEIRTSRRQDPKDSADDSTTPPILIYALVNTTSDALTQLATTYSADEIAFVKRVLDYMFEENNTRRSEGMIISSMQAMRLSKAGSDRRRSTNVATQQTESGNAQNLTMQQAQEVMKSLTQEGWLEQSRKGNYSLSPRALMELRTWLVSEYNYEDMNGQMQNRIKFCAACKDIITVGQRCDDRNCPGRLHDHCVRNFFRMQQAETCPVCQKGWSGNNYVGERAVVEAARPRHSRLSQAQTVVASPTPTSEAGDPKLSDEEEG